MFVARTMDKLSAYNNSPTQCCPNLHQGVLLAGKFCLGGSRFGDFLLPALLPTQFNRVGKIEVSFETMSPCMSTLVYFAENVLMESSVSRRGALKLPTMPG